MSSSPTYPLLRASQWWCGDDVCDCTQYRIERVDRAQPPRRGYTREPVWEGKFTSDSSELTREERAERLRAFRNAARANGIRLSSDEWGQWTGERPA